MIRRKVLSFEPDPADGHRRLYRLACGHTVNRRTNGSKRWALCSDCSDEDDGLA